MVNHPNRSTKRRRGRGTLTTTPEQFLAELFEFEYCAECGGDACHHTAIPFFGNWFARCDYPPAEDDVATPDPIIRAYREAAGAPWTPDR